jgi:hypothetical protein
MAAFPEINSSHVICQLPYTEIDRWVVHQVTLDCGKSYTERQHELPLREFVVRYPSITRAELTILEDFFDEMAGGTGEFEFTDSGGTMFPFTRFDQDELEIEYPQPGQISVQFKLSCGLA